MKKDFIDDTTYIILVSTYLLFNLQESLAIDEAGSRLMEKNVIDVFYLFSNRDTSNNSNLSNPNVNLRLVYQNKCDKMFSNPKLDHIFSHFLGTYLVNNLFLLLCGKYPLTLKRGRCRNLLSIDS